MNWQPIDSAPKDDNFLVVVADTVFAAYRINGGEIFSECRHEPFVGDPTHWQPLPAPPEAE